MKGSKEREIKLISNDEVDKLKQPKKKERKVAQDKKLIDRPCESNIY